MFKPRKSKKSKEQKPNESFNASFETWEKKCTPKKTKDTYMKGKVLDYISIEDDSLPTQSVRVTGPGIAKGLHPYTTHISQERLKSMLVEGHYIDTEALDAALSLIDRKLSEDCTYAENVTVYSNTTLRLISCGQEDLVNDGYFIAVLPKKFGIVEEEKRMKRMKTYETHETRSYRG